MSSITPMNAPAPIADFIGREWVFRRLSKWMEVDEQRIFLITGEPGSGKSTLAARLVQISAEEATTEATPHLVTMCLTYSHFCQARFDSTLDPLRFVEALSLQLANRYQPFALALSQMSNQNITINATPVVGTVESGGQVAGVIIKELHIGNLSARVAFDHLVRKPLERLCTKGFQETIVILVDSLDEALTYSGEENIVVLLSHTFDVPQQVRFLLTSRADPRVSHLIGESSLNIIDDAPDDVDDVQEYAYQRLHTLADPRRRELAKRVAEAGKGNFLYVRHVLDDLLPMVDQVTDLSSLALPMDLKDVYRQFLKRELGQNLGRWTMHYRPLLGALTVARGQGLTRRQLAGITRHKQSEIDDLLQTCTQYLSSHQSEGPFRIYHQSLRDFLLDDERYRIYPDEANHAVADFFLNEYEDNWLRCKEDYALQYTPAHLIEALQQVEQRQEREKLKDNLIALLTDLGFLEAKTALLGVDATLDDLRSALGLEAWESNPPSPVLTMLRMLDRESYLLRDQRLWPERLPALFYQQLFNRSIEEGHPLLIGKAPTRWLRQVSQVGAEDQYLIRVFPSQDFIESVAFSPDGKQILSGSWDKTAYLWETESGKLLRKFEGPTSRVTSVAFSHDGRKVLVGTTDCTVWLWEVASGKLLWTCCVENIYFSFLEVFFSPDDDQVVIGCESSICVLETKSGYLLRRWNWPLTTNSNRSFALSPLGHKLLIGTEEGEILLFDTESGQKLLLKKDTGLWVEWVAFFPDGHKAFSGEIALWEIESRRVLQTFGGYLLGINNLACSPDGQKVLANAGSVAYLWETESAQMLQTFVGHTNLITSVAFSPDGSKVLSASSDKTVRLWRIAKEKQSTLVQGQTAYVMAVAFSPDGSKLVTGSHDNTARLWDTESGRLLQTFEGHTNAVSVVGFLPDGSKIFTGSDLSVRLWEIKSNRLLQTFENCLDRGLSHLVFSPDGSKFLTTKDETGVLWETESGKLLQTFQGHTSHVRDVAFSPDGRKLLTGSNDDTARLWETESGRLLHIFEGHTEAVAMVDFSPDGHKVLTLDGLKTILLWDVESKRLLDKLEGHDHIGYAKFSPDGQLIVVCDWNGQVRFWKSDAQDRYQVVALYPATFHIMAIHWQNKKRMILADGGGFRFRPHFYRLEFEGIE
jgi:WD40 repeat protein